MSARRVFEMVYDSVMTSWPFAIPMADLRFHISDLGGSSFEDTCGVILVESEHGAQRCLWRRFDDEVIHDCYLAPKTMERVAAEFSAEFGREFGFGRPRESPRT